MSKIKRILIKILGFLRKIYWFIFRPQTRGAKCIIEYNGKILLVRLSYAYKGWTIPGGGVGKKETYEKAMGREIFEEVGIELKEVKKIDRYLSTKYYKRDTVEIFYSKIDSDYVKIDNFEIEEFCWFNPKDSLPIPHSTRLPDLVEKFKLFQKSIN